MTPMPPSCAMAIAMRDSVTVSMAALRSGMLQRDVAGEPRGDVDLRGSTVEWRGTSRTSSKVRAVFRPELEGVKK